MGRLQQAVGAYKTSDIGWDQVLLRLIEGHVTIVLGICGFLFVINHDYASTLHDYMPKDT